MHKRDSIPSPFRKASVARGHTRSKGERGQKKKKKREGKGEKEKGEERRGGSEDRSVKIDKEGELRM